MTSYDLITVRSGEGCTQEVFFDGREVTDFSQVPVELARRLELVRDYSAGEMQRRTGTNILITSGELN